MKANIPENLKPPNTGKSPGFWFMVNDYEKDVQILSLAAQGLWTRMICWAASNESNRGFLELPNGEPMSVQIIAKKVGETPRKITLLLSEMETIGVFSRDDRGCIYNRRMARETHVSESRRNAANLRWQKEMEAVRKASVKRNLHSKTDANQYANAHANQYAKGDAHPHAKSMQNSPVSDSVSVSVSSINTQEGVCEENHAKTELPEAPLALPAPGPPEGNRVSEPTEQKPPAKAQTEPARKTGTGGLQRLPALVIPEASGRPDPDQGWEDFKETCAAAEALDGSSIDWRDAQNRWRMLPIEDKIRAKKGIENRIGTGDFVLRMSPQNYLAKRSWEKQIRKDQGKQMSAADRYLHGLDD
jgi:hypothetical protein